MVFASTCRAADRGRVPRNPPVRAKVPFFARTQLFVSGGALVVARLSLAEGRLLQIHGSCIIVAWRCGPPLSEAPQSMCSASSQLRPGVWSHRPSLRTELPALQSVPLLASLPGPLSSLFPCPSLPPPGLDHRRSPPAPTRQCRS